MEAGDSRDAFGSPVDLTKSSEWAAWERTLFASKHGGGGTTSNSFGGTIVTVDDDDDDGVIAE